MKWRKDQIKETATQNRGLNISTGWVNTLT